MAPTFRHKSLVMLIEGLPKGNTTTNHLAWTVQWPSAAAALSHGAEKAALVLDASCEML